MIMEDFIHSIYVGSMQPSMHMDIWKGKTFPTQVVGVTKHFISFKHQRLKNEQPQKTGGKKEEAHS